MVSRNVSIFYSQMRNKSNKSTQMRITFIPEGVKSNIADGRDKCTKFNNCNT